jgi:peptidoglycan/LPS O-acetylase OafA/YrhL
MIFKEKINFVHLDFLRGISALFVVLGHTRAVFFESYDKLARNSILDNLFFFITGFGHQSVIIFFVLSGFFIINNISENNSKNNFWIKYTLNRIIRLWVVLIPSLLITLLLDRFGILLGFSEIYSGFFPFGGIVNCNLSENLGIAIFFGNIFFLNGIITDSFGSNVALWSLPYEFWYYAIFPFVFLIFKNGWWNFKTLICFSIVGLIFIFVGIEIFKYFFIWCMGGGIPYIIKNIEKILKRKIYSIIVIFSFFIMLIFSRISNTGYFVDFLLSFLTANFIVVLILNENKIKSLFYINVSNFLSKFSFSLYTIHLPILFFIYGFFYKYCHFDSFIFNKYFSFGIAIVLILFVSYVIYLLFEKNTSKVKNWIFTRIIYRKT